MRLYLFLLTAVLVLSCSPASAQKEFGFDNRKSSGQPYLKPEETVARMKVPDEFEVKLFAGEPDLVNPVAMTVDEKGRVWVIECFEYPKRTTPGKMPRDRIVILEDTNGDGVCDKRTVFAEGKDFPVPFDLATGLEVGNGGVYVGAPPYLFFIENKNDKPGKFEILLKGFGSQDTHETLNTFQWGPDGCLYGLHGVFTQSAVKPEQADGPVTRLNAAVWRFDHAQHKFDIFAEGTSNPWGMDWRNTDGQFILCCCVIPHLYHMVPGGIYRRQGGQSFNPYAYGEIKEISDHTFHKESGWAHAGLVCLDTPLIPEKYRNSVIFGSIHGCSLKQNILKPSGSTYVASRGDDFLISADKNFRPINLRWGPNGEIYCIDWHDQNPCHQAAADSWDYERGRVYRIQTRGLKTAKAEDLGAKGLVDLAAIALKDPNPYRYRTALRLIRERQQRAAARGAAPAVPQNLFEEVKRQQRAGDSAGRLRATLVQDALRVDGLPFENDDAAVRTLAVRLAQTPPSAAEIGALLSLTKTEQSLAVQREIASLLARGAGQRELADLAREALLRFDRPEDPLIPNLLWVAYEKVLAGAGETELAWLAQHAHENKLIKSVVVPRAMRRMIATGDPKLLDSCIAFVRDTSDLDVKRASLVGLAQGLRGRQINAPANWKSLQVSLKAEPNSEIQTALKQLSVSFRDAAAIKQALAIAEDGSKPAAERVLAIRDLALTQPDSAAAPLLKLATSAGVEEIRAEAIRALASFEDPGLPKKLLSGWEQFSPGLKTEVVNTLAARKEWARALLDAVGAGKVARTELNVNTITRIANLKDKNLDGLIEKVWGRVRSTPAELNELINKTRASLDETPASFERGRLAFDTHCAKCHKFEGRGHEVGPNIEGAGRDIEYLLVNILDPNRIIGAPYFIRTITKTSGQNEIGILAAEDDQTITLKAENGVLKVIAKKDIEESRIQEKSLMPEGFGSNIKLEDFRDLLRYTMANPFITNVRLGMIGAFAAEGFSPRVGVTGRIPIPDAKEATVVVVAASVTAPEALKTKLLVGIREAFEVKVNDVSFKGKGSGAFAQPDQIALDVELRKGENKIELIFNHKGKDEAVYLRLVDPDRKLRYPEPPPVEKK